MAKYKVLRKCVPALSGTTERRQCNPGEIIETDGWAAYLQPHGDAEALARWKDWFPHAPRSFVGL